MTLDLAASSRGPDAAPWVDPARYWSRLAAATAHLPAPVGALELGALRHNAADLVRRAHGTPIRLASKSVRVRAVIEAALRMPGYRGVLAYTVAEAIWLADTVDDIVVGYPSADRASLHRLATDPDLAARIAIMVDSPAQLDVVDGVLPPCRREEVRVCLELDASWRAPMLGHVGVRRSPVREAADAAALAAYIEDRAGFRLVGLMAYEAQIAGVLNRPAGRPVTGAVNRWMQGRSMPELVARRAQAVAAVREHADLEFVNGGGTGSLEATAGDASVTEIAAGSGLFGGHLFDGYAHFTPAPAAAFALDVVRRPDRAHATVLGGGWIASGPPGADRMPLPVWPEGLRYVDREGAGEVQTPLTGPAANDLGVGDRVWFRHTKSGELAEHVNELHVVEDDQVVAVIPTYRGEGKAFL